MSTHTSTPWRADGIAVYAAGQSSQVAQGFDPTQRTADKWTNVALARANAAFIVRAVNAHAGLVDALRDCRAALAAVHDYGTASDGENPDIQNGALDRARAALKAAGVEP